MASLLFGLSELYCERGDVAGAERLFEQGETLALSPSLPATPYRRYLAEACLLRTRGDAAGALTALDRAQPLYFHGAGVDVRPIPAAKSRLWVVEGRLSEAQEWADTERLSVDDELGYAREFDHITLARLLLAQADLNQAPASANAALRLLERLHDAAMSGSRMTVVIELLILQARGHQALDDTPAALAQLDRALTLAQREGYVSLFRDEGAPMLKLLRQSEAGAGPGSAYAHRLVQAFDGSPMDAVRIGSATATNRLATPLTPRERELLRLLAAGMTNQEIANDLVLSLFTVKRHLANAYGKLGVGHRTAAVARAHELALI